MQQTTGAKETFVHMNIACGTQHLLYEAFFKKAKNKYKWFA